MTAWVDINKYWCDGGAIFKKWLEAYGFIITNDTAEVIIIDYYTWKNTQPNYKDTALIVILSDHYKASIEIPSNAVLELIPIDYPVLIENLIEFLESKKAPV